LVTETLFRPISCVVFTACAVSYQYLHAHGFVTVRSDVTGYYEYLPAMQQYHDPWLRHITERPVNERDATV
jgi:hypothetical protein